MSLQIEERPAGQPHRMPHGAWDRLPQPSGMRPWRPAPTLGTSMLVGVAAFLVYLRTLAPSIVWGDSPELTAAAYTGGVPHPTGYPLYMLLAHAFLRLCPLGSIAYRMNLLAALSAALAVACIYPLMLRVTRDRGASLAASLLFAYSRTFWSQAVVAEHYCFEILGMAAVLGCVVAWDGRGERGWLRTAAMLYGLCLTHHMMSLLMAPGLLFFALTSRYRAHFLRELRWTVPLCLLPLTLYLYLPLTALRDPPVNWGDPRTWDAFLAHVTGREYQRGMFHMTGAELWKQVRAYAVPGADGSDGFLPAQFGTAFLWLALLGAASLARRHPRLFGLTLLLYRVDLGYAFNYFIYNVELYYLPSHLMVAIWIGCGLHQGRVWLRQFGQRIARRPVGTWPLRALSGAALLFLPLGPLRGNWRVNDRHDDWHTLAYGRAVLADLKPHALLIGEGDNTYFPLLYTHFVEQRRPDVTLLAAYDVLRAERLRLTTRLAGPGLIVRVPPHFNDRRHFDNRLLKQLVADNIDHRPVYLLDSPGVDRTALIAQVTAPYYPVASSNLPTVELCRRAPLLAVSRPRPQNPRRILFGRRGRNGRIAPDLEFLGYDLQPIQKAEGPWLRMSYYWRVGNQAVARPAMVWVLFANQAGYYERMVDGTPEFHNIHPLAYGAGERPPRLPATLRETYDLFVPPRLRNKPLYIRLAVAWGNQFLSADGYATYWMEIGELPAAPGPGQ